MEKVQLKVTVQEIPERTKQLRELAETCAIVYAVLAVLFLWVGAVMWTPALFLSGFFAGRVLVWVKRVKITSVMAGEMERLFGKEKE